MTRLSLSLVAAALAAGCESSPTEPQVDVSATLAQMAASGIGSYATAAAGSGVVLPAPNTSAPCPYDVATHFFVCAPITSNGLTFSRQFQLLDGSGAPLNTYNGLTVASIRSVIDLEGTMTQPTPAPMTLQIDRHEDATLSGIQSANRVMNGTATQSMSLTSSGNAMTTSETSVTTNLQLPSSADRKYPLGGRIATTGTTTLSGSLATTHDYTREISFDGTSVMTVKTTSGSLTMTCRIDLTAPAAAPNCT